MSTTSGSVPPTDLDGVMSVVDHGHHVVAERFELTLEAGGHRLLVIGDQHLVRSIHKTNLPLTSHSDGNTREPDSIVETAGRSLQRQTRQS